MKRYLLWLSFCFFSHLSLGESLEALSRSKACQRAVHSAVSSEKMLRRKGFDSVWTHGLDELEQDWIPLAQELRESKAEAIKTHIPQFAERIPQHIEFMAKQLGLDKKLKRIKRRKSQSLERDRALLSQLANQKGYIDFIAQYPDQEWDLKFAYLRYKERADQRERAPPLKISESELFPSDDVFGEYAELMPTITADSLFDFMFASAESLNSAGLDDHPANIFKDLERKGQWTVSLKDVKSAIDYYREDSDSEVLDIVSGSESSGLARILLLDKKEDIAFPLVLRDFFDPAGPKSKQPLKNLIRLADGAAKAVKNKEVSYRWWLSFNHLLLLAMKGYFSLQDIKDSNSWVDFWIPLFPDIILMPSLKGEQGIMTINKAARQDIFLPSFMKYGPYALGFYAHDLSHARLIIDISREQNLLNKLFYDYLTKNSAQLSDQKRKIYETLYFYLTYEAPSNWAFKTPQELKLKIMRMILPDILSKELSTIKWIALSEALPRQARQIEQMAEDFAGLLAAINKGLKISPSAQIQKAETAVQPAARGQKSKHADTAEQREQPAGGHNGDFAEAANFKKDDKTIKLPPSILVFSKYSERDFAELYNLAAANGQQTDGPFKAKDFALYPDW